MASNTDAYLLSRTFASSVRLNLQHFLHKKDLGWIIHPAIHLQGQNLKIADVGTGTGIWLIDLNDDLPKSSVLEGFDITDKQFPHEAWLPPNIRLSVQDIFADVPEKLNGRYDLVNLRYFLIAVRDNNPHLIIQNIFKMLKPGGYLQWMEYDGHVNFNSTAPGIDEARWEEVKKEVERQTGSSPARFQWLSELTKSLEQGGFVDIKRERKSSREDMFSFWQQSTLMVADEMSYSRPQGNKIRELVQQNDRETPKGVYWNRPHLIFTAKKPLT